MNKLIDEKQIQCCSTVTDGCTVLYLIDKWIILRFSNLTDACKQTKFLRRMKIIENWASWVLLVLFWILRWDMGPGKI